jgi:endonuclease/exonuclease/phosphatase family metal-dependent hydrolase
MQERGEDTSGIKLLRAAGGNECKKALTLLKVGRLPEDFIEGMVCPGGCVGGPSRHRHISEITKARENLLSKADDSGVGIVVATYNVKSFGRETSGFRSGDILTEMKSQYVDILCLQEYSDISGDRLNSNTYKDYFPYMSYGKDDMVIYSRFPIKESGTIDFGETNNSAMWADIIVNGKEIRIFNAHLETTGFNRSLHKVAKMELQGQVVKESAIIKMIYENYTMGMVARSHQSEQVAKEIEESPNPVIVCGDFNDIPYSYTYYTMLGNLVDGFKECGSGWMSTFRDRKKFRIDYIFHDHALQGRTYYKLDLSYSDHDPVFMKIAFK